MPAAKKSPSKSVRKTTTKAKKKSKPSVMGTYSVPRGDVALSVPAFWAFRQTNDDLQLVSPSGETSVIINAYSRNPEVKSLDSREYLKHFLANAPRESRVTIGKDGSRARAWATYRDSEGNSWLVQFLTNGKLLLLAEMSTSGTLKDPEAKTGAVVLESIRLKK